MDTNGLPRKVTVGTCWMRPEKIYDGPNARLERLAGLVDEMARQAEARGWSLDIACLPEDANMAGDSADVGPRAEDLPADGDAFGPTLERMAKTARRHRTYLVVPHFVRAGGALYNSAALLDREGRLVGRYDKLHGVEEPELSGRIEQGCTPGRGAPVFDLDFGRVGFQICFDLLYADGWRALEEAGAEIVFWPSAYPGVQHLGQKSWQHAYYVVSSPWRPPCGIYDPTGHALAAAGQADGPVLVERIDLQWRLMPWKSAKDRGLALKARYGDRIRIIYRNREDIWLVWSDSDDLPVDRVLEENDLEPLGPYLERMRVLQNRVRGVPPLV